MQVSYDLQGTPCSLSQREAWLIHEPLFDYGSDIVVSCCYTALMQQLPLPERAHSMPQAANQQSPLLCSQCQQVEDYAGAWSAAVGKLTSQ